MLGDPQCLRQRPGQSHALGAEERPQLEPVEAGGREVGADLLDAVLTGIQVEDEFLLGVRGDAAEERAP